MVAIFLTFLTAVVGNMMKSENYTLVNDAGQALTYYTFVDDDERLSLHFTWNVQKRPLMFHC